MKKIIIILLLSQCLTNNTDAMMSELTKKNKTIDEKDDVNVELIKKISKFSEENPNFSNEEFIETFKTDLPNTLNRGRSLKGAMGLLFHPDKIKTLLKKLSIDESTEESMNKFYKIFTSNFDKNKKSNPLKDSNGNDEESKDNAEKNNQQQQQKQQQQQPGWNQQQQQEQTGWNQYQQQRQQQQQPGWNQQQQQKQQQQQPGWNQQQQQEQTGWNQYQQQRQQQQQYQQYQQQQRNQQQQEQYQQYQQYQQQQYDEYKSANNKSFREFTSVLEDARSIFRTLTLEDASRESITNVSGAVYKILGLKIVGTFELLDNVMQQGVFESISSYLSAANNFVGQIRADVTNAEKQGYMRKKDIENIDSICDTVIPNIEQSAEMIESSVVNKMDKSSYKDWMKKELENLKQVSKDHEKLQERLYRLLNF
jgi:hypothetical protein